MNAREYVKPSASFFKDGKRASGETEETIARISKLLQEILNDFNIGGQVVRAVSGPRVTRYEIALAPGVGVDKISGIQNNIKMRIAVQEVRISVRVPDNIVGVEVPNQQPEVVSIRPLLESNEWRTSNAKIPVLLGQGVSGEISILDLACAPHLLIAGATGSGKSIFINTLIMSLLLRFSPNELKLILIDHKVVEMEMYQTLPHLLTSVINYPQKIPVVLRWCVAEMENRYHILEKTRTENLAEFNSRFNADAGLTDEDGKPIPDKLPFLVIIVDELADAMLTDARADIEMLIDNIAQRGHIVGIHMVIATQRSSSLVITDIIKTNLPTRIAFKTASGIDSRMILDKVGAEELLGRGDMLLEQPDTPAPERIQGAFVDDADIEKVVEFVSAQALQQFDSSILKNEAEDDGEILSHGFEHISPLIQKYLMPGDDDLMRKSLEIVLRERAANVHNLWGSSENSLVLDSFIKDGMKIDAKHFDLQLLCKILPSGYGFTVMCPATEKDWKMLMFSCLIILTVRLPSAHRQDHRDKAKGDLLSEIWPLLNSVKNSAEKLFGEKTGYSIHIHDDRIIVENDQLVGAKCIIPPKSLDNWSFEIW